MPDDLLDAIDVRILEILQKDGRLTNLDLAERVGLSPSPCLRRLRRLEDDGYISGYGARVDRNKVGLGLTAFISVKVLKHGETNLDQVRKAINSMPEIIACYVMSGQHDLLLHVLTADLDEFRSFTLDKLLKKVPAIHEMNSSFVIETLKENAILPIGKTPVRKS